MIDLEGLPLFAGLDCPDPARPMCTPDAVPRPDPAPAPRLAGAADAAPRPRPRAEMIPFPACRRVDLVASLATEFMKLRPQHGRRSRTILVEKRFKPLRARLKRLGVPAEVIRQEMSCLEAAVAEVVWRCDGGGEASEPGGGSAA
ncbi:MAG: hypothetical protein K2X71_18945 [Methylobacterium sp.]|uniref:DUF6074 family protein n=1 Tax=Methylobacterium sp. TaxID=409 RepID=UPI002582D67E|nr:DUF6074 family protein [Methylobacterium sp.]MBY0298079.1 hypothetical protein [Methylobacterium sp.]